MVTGAGTKNLLLTVTLNGEEIATFTTMNDTCGTCVCEKGVYLFTPQSSGQLVITFTLVD